MSQRIRHYQTSFVVSGGNPDIDKLYQAQYLVGEWVKGIEGSRYAKMRRNRSASFLIKGDFTHRAEYKSRYSWCKTNYYVSEDSCAWAMEYTHRDTEKFNVFWVSEIGLRFFNDTKNLIVSVKISYEISTEFGLVGEEFCPSVSIPKCVLGILETFDDCKFSSGDQDVTEGLRSPVSVANVDHAKKVAAYINSNDRKLAVVVLSGECPEVRKTAEYFCKNFFGKALVYIVSYDIAVRKALVHVKTEYGFGMFIPPFAVHDEKLPQKLWFKASLHPESEIEYGSILRGWLGVHQIFECGAVQDLEGVVYWIRRHELEKFRNALKNSVSKEKFEELNTSFSELNALFGLSEQENKELRNEKKALKAEKKQLKDDKEMLKLEKEELKDQHKAEIYSIKQHHQGELRRRLESRDLPRELPLTIASLRTWAGWFEHLIIPDKAWEGMTSRSREEFVKTAWDMLWCLENVVFAFYDGEETGEPGRIIEERTGYKFSSHESGTTESRGEWARERTVEIGGKKYECFKHLKKRDGAANAMRVYFDYSPELARIVVVHIGEHLTTKGTART